MKKYNCKCGNEICSVTAIYGSGLCRSCARKKEYKEGSHPFLKLVGKHPHNYKGIKGNFICIDCKLPISDYRKRCKSCENRRRIELGIICQKGVNAGDKNPNWQGGISRLPYSPDWAEQLRDSIRNRDHYECQNCGMTEEEHIIVVGQVLTVHHIDYNKKNCVENNLISLCNQCNSRANFNRLYWQEFYTNKILLKI